jgi:hypothetical protein
MTAITTSLIVPFGKYEGMPIEALLKDTSYVQWLMVQPWFTSGKYPRVYQHVTGKCVEYSKTPVHNEMQIRFLDKDLCFNLFRLCYGNVEYHSVHWSQLYGIIYGIEDMTPKARLKGAYPDEVVSVFDNDGKELGVAGRDNRLVFNPGVERTLKAKLDIFFEKDNWDIYLVLETILYIGNKRLSPECYCLKIELKPTVGDDYPHILRQMNKRKIEKPRKYPDDWAVEVVLFDKFNAISHTESKSRELFRNAGYRLLKYSTVIPNKNSLPKGLKVEFVK